MTSDEIRYALQKQLATAETIQTAYGEIQLDDELRQVVEKAVRSILVKRLDEEVPPC